MKRLKLVTTRGPYISGFEVALVNMQDDFKSRIIRFPAHTANNGVEWYVLFGYF